MGTMQNVSVSEFKEFLKSLGLTHFSTRGGHEKWARPGLPRPVIFQTHINPIPERVIRTNLRTVGAQRGDLEKFLARRGR